MTSIVIGVDPGVTGALARFASGVLTDIKDMPVTLKTLHRSGADLRDLIGGKKKIEQRAIDSAGLADLLREWTAGHSAVVFKEKMSTRPNQNSSKIMLVDGILIGTLAGIGVECRFVEPAEWKRVMRVPADKKLARQIAIDTFPSWKTTFARAMDHNRAEAALIGLYGVRHGGQ